MARKQAAKDSTEMERMRFQKRCDAVEAVQRGESPTDVARVFGIGARSIFVWLSWYRQSGLKGLREGKRSGRPPKVNATVMKWLHRAITRNDPQQFEFKFCLWTLGIIRQMLKQKHGIELSKSAICRLMQQLGLTPQRPIYKSIKQSKTEMTKYLDKTFPQIREQARRTGALIFFVDEASIRSDSHRGTTWGKSGKTPVVKDTGDRFGVRLISAVSPRGDMRFGCIEGTMTGERFVEFLKKLHSDVGRPIIVIADNASYHHGKTVQAFTAANVDKVTVVNLPRYSPELNPGEQVWNHAKARLGKLFLDSKESMLAAVKSTMLSIQKNADLIKSFFKLKDTAYAAGE